MSEDRSLGFVAASFLLIMGGMYLGMDLLVDRRSHPNRGLVTGTDGPLRIELEPDPAGQYLVPGEINGREVTFLIDTGATHVAVPAHVAEQLDLVPGPEVAVDTAGGRTRAASTVMDWIAVGGIELHDVEGTINPALTGDEILLGMSFLRHVEFRHRGNRLVLEAPR